jgi:DNA repair protein RecO (recombination protein O)
MLARGRQLDVVTQAETVETFAAMRQDLWRASLSHYVAELVDGFGAEGLANYPLYALTIATLRRLASDASVEVTVRSFELQLLGLTGYRPQLHRCLACDSSIQPGANRFSVRMGGVLCPNCVAADTAAPVISDDALKLLRNLQTNEEAVFHLPALDRSVLRETEQRLYEYIVYRLETRPRSLRFLERLRAEGAAP